MPAPAIDRSFERRLATLVNGGGAPLLRDGLRGVEKESLRVTPDGRIATTAHPRALGSALTNEQFTTDYSEALIELVTPTFTTTWELLQYLCDMHQFVYRHLGEERLWATSMPCRIDSDESIPIAQYGSSHIGRMKTIYREGLGLRYGRVMQAISGVHFNYSFPEKFWEPYAALRECSDSVALRSAAYFDLLRNYRRHGWLVLYLFGVSPAVCSSFLRVRGETLPAGSQGTAFEPYATTLRMSDLGYRNRKQAGVSVSVNSLEDYVRDLGRAISTPYPPYEALGVNVDGTWRQLNANLLQIENEYYSYIRPKRVARSGERPTKALRRGGVEYVEVRALDVSAFDPVGVNQAKLRFLEAFLALCLLRESPPIGSDEEEALDRNHVLVARRGREPGLMLQRNGRAVPMADWAAELIDGMSGLCEILDAGDPARPYSQALAVQQEKLRDVARTPSARLMNELQATGESFFDLAQRMSSAHKAYFLELHPPNTARLDEFRKGAEESIARQQSIEAADTGSFEAFLGRYFEN
jgi:glutamate--cysteine ligase